MTTQQQQTVVVLGGTGGIGRAIVEELAGRGHDVVSVNRAGDAEVPDGVARRAGDLLDAASTRAAVAGADVVVMAAQPDYGAWDGPFQTMVEHVIDATAAVDARLVMVDNLYMYGAPDGPISADTPEAPVSAFGEVRAALSRRLRAAHEEGRVRIAIGRFSDYYGPTGHNSGLHATAIEPGIAGRRMRGMFALDVLHTFHYLPDAARAFATLVEDDRADGRVWILPAAPAATQREMLVLLNDVLPTPVGIGVIGPRTMRLGALFLADARNSLHVRDQFLRPWLVDASAFEATFGPFAATPHARALAETVAAHRGAEAVVA
jgi:nucleoside-diphosphate-sugar epimerase